MASVQAPEPPPVGAEGGAFLRSVRFHADSMTDSVNV
jgi:hypothetical protein